MPQLKKDSPQRASWTIALLGHQSVMCLGLPFHQFGHIAHLITSQIIRCSMIEVISVTRQLLILTKQLIANLRVIKPLNPRTILKHVHMRSTISFLPTAVSQELEQLCTAVGKNDIVDLVCTCFRMVRGFKGMITLRFAPTCCSPRGRHMFVECMNE